MKIPFDIEKAKNGAKVVTRDGFPVEILKYDYVDYDEKKIVCCYQDEDGNSHAHLTYLDGLCFKNKEDNKDIFIEEEQTYRPYANASEMDEAIKEHGVCVKHRNGKRMVIKCYDDNDTSVSVGAGCTYGALLEYFTWIDGTPCGVLEGGEE